MLRTGADIVVRRARPLDSDRLARVFADSWRNAYAGIIPDSHLEGLIRRRGSIWWRQAIKTEGHLLVLEIGGELAGYATCGAARSGGRYRGEIYELYLNPLHLGLGLGEYLFEACRSHLDNRGLDGLIVWALADNTFAGDFYRRRGGRSVGRAVERFGASKLVKIAYGWD
jgi:GNAT superfamily N-acetyltransferase